MKKSFFLLVCLLMFLSCADEKTFTKSDGTTFVAEPYGWANMEARKIEGVVYECSFANVVWSVLFCETVIVPVWLTGWEICEPVRYVEPKKEKL